MDYIQVTPDNIDKEHICCAISNNSDVQVCSKKDWLRRCFADWLVFLKSTERGKCFIEYIPAENAWVPVIAENYMYIDCLWVAGSMKGHGYANDLLSACIEDSKAKGRAGLCILTTPKKKPFLADPGFLKKKGFMPADRSDCGIELWYLPFGEETVKPRFTEKARHPRTDEAGYVLYYTNQCPYNAKYVPVVAETAAQHGIPFKAVCLETKEQAQAACAPVTTYALFKDGAFLTNEQQNDKRFLKLAGMEQ